MDVDEDQLSSVLEAVLREAERRADPQPSIGLQCALIFAFAAAMLATTSSTRIFYGSLVGSAIYGSKNLLANLIVVQRRLVLSTGA